MSQEERIAILEAELKEAKRQLRINRFNDSVVFENDCIVIERKKKRRHKIQIKQTIGEKYREKVSPTNGNPYITTNRTYAFGIWKIEDFDKVIASLKEAKEFIENNPEEFVGEFF